MRVKDIMSVDVESVPAETAATDAWDRMQRRGFHHLVVAERGRVVGILSSRDLGDKRGGAVREGRRVAELMTRQMITAKPTTTVRQAANLLRGCHIGSLPVLEGARVVGILTVTDLLELLGKGGGRTAERSRSDSDRAPHRGQHRRPR